MASDSTRLQRAYEKYEKLAQDERFSVSPEAGRVAILLSEDSQFIAPEEVFIEEALTIANRYQKGGNEVDIVACSDKDEALDQIADETVHTIVTIGDGSFSEFWLPQTSKSRRNACIDWWDISRASTHLKTGYFIHRTCGHFNRNVNLPPGTFLMADRRNIIGAFGRYVDNEKPNEDEFEQIFKKPSIPLPALMMLGSTILKRNISVG